MSDVAVCLGEWEQQEPATNTSLAGLTLGDNATRALARELSRSRKLEVLELAQGIDLRSTSFVGRVRLGQLVVTVRPKITGMPLLTLLRYAYGLRDLQLLRSTAYAAGESPFQELLIFQLVAEVAELIARGLHREYTREHRGLSSPRGRLDFQTHARQGGTARAELPCIHYPRLASTIINQVLLTGLWLCVRLTDDLMLRARLRRLASILEMDVEPIHLDATTLALAQRNLDRRTVAYRPALTLIGMLLDGAGLLLDARAATLQLSGFLFDMNLFFQAVLARFLQEHLHGYVVREQYRLTGMLSYVPGQNPRHRRSPEPRPDYVVLDGTSTAALLDAKYRDLWEHPLPREMLYQLAIYALSQRVGAEAVILYPTLATVAREARIVIRDPVHGGDRAYVVVRPVDLNRLAKLIASPIGYQSRQACATFAHYMAFGVE